MGLSNDIINQFVKITNDDTDTSQGSIAYGVTVQYADRMYVKLDGSDVLTPVETTSTIKSGERVTVLIQDHNATVTGNVTNPSASSTDVIEIGNKIAEFDIVIADKVDTKILNAETARIEELIATKASIGQLEADRAEIEHLIANKAEITELEAIKAEITDLEAIKADIEILDAEVADIETLVNGHLTSDNIQSLALTSDKVTVDDAFIKDAMIDNVSANKITSGQINTSLVSISSEDGSMTLNGSSQQFKDSEGTVRIQIGKDAEGNFTFCLFSQDGVGILLDEEGIHAGAVPDGLIVNDMVADNANISGGKLDINSVITSINDGTTTINSSRIYLDEEGQSLKAAFNQLKTTVDRIDNITVDGNLSSIIEQITNNTTNINIMQGEISSLIFNTTITKQNGEVVQLKDEYNSTKNTVDNHTTKIGSLETTVDSVSSKQASMELDLNGFKTTVSDTYTTKNEFNEVSSKQSSLEQTVDSFKTTVSRVEAQSTTNYNNLIINSAMKNSKTSWYINYSSLMIPSTTPSNKPEDNHSILIDCRTTPVYANSTRIKVNPGETYTVGMWGRCAEHNDYLRVYSLFCETDTLDNSYISSPIVMSYYYKDSIDWQYKSATFTIPEGTSYLAIKVRGQSTQTTEDYDGRCWFSCLMLCRGDIVGSWTGNSNDNYGEVVDSIESVESTVSQTADKIGWMVKSGTSQSNMTLTDKMYSLISKNINLTADRINLNGYINANETFKVDTSGNVLLGDTDSGSYISLYATNGTIRCFENSILRSIIQDGQFRFNNNSGTRIGSIGASNWVNAPSKWLTAVHASYGHTVGLGAQYTSTGNYICSTLISSIDQSLGDYYYYQGTNINAGHFTGGLKIHSQRTSNESYPAIIEATQTNGSGLKVYGNNYGLVLGTRNSNALKVGIRFTADSAQTNGVYANAFTPINMNNYKIFNSSISSTSDRTLKENIKYLDYNSINPKARTIESDDITLDDMYNFINNDYMLANYNYIGDEEKTISAIAQDLLVNTDGTDNKVGQLVTHRCKKSENCGEGTIIGTDTENGNIIEEEMVESETIAINQTELLNITIGALQKACEKIESLERQIQQLQDIINGEE